MRTARDGQRGETLAALLVGLALGLLVLAASAQMLAQMLRGHRLALQDSHLQQDLHFAMDLMARELQNAQYVADAWRSRDPQACADEFCDQATDFVVGTDRIEFSLDRNHSGGMDSNECSGFRVSDGVLLRRVGCRASDWQPLSDKSTVWVTALRATLTCRWAAGWVHRRVVLALDSQWPGDPERRMLLQRHVALRNPLPAAVQALYCP